MPILTETADTAFVPAARTQSVDFLGLTIAATAMKRLVAFVRAERQAAAERQRMVRELNSYTDLGLAELGLSRLDIPALAAGTYRA